jgi:hypothetical protein
MNKSLSILLLISFFCISITNLFSQIPWKHFYGYSQEKSLAYDFVETYDKGYMIGGMIYSDTYYETGWIIKTDINGNKLYEKKIGDGSKQSSTFSFDKTSDGGFIIGGWYNTSGNYLDAYAMKFNACGEKEWCTMIPSPENAQSSIDGGIHEVPGGGYIAHRTVYSYDTAIDRVSLVKFRNDGSVEWMNSYANDPKWINEIDWRMIVTSDTCFLMSGLNDYELVPDWYYQLPYWYKVDTKGNQRWIYTWEGDIYQSPGDARKAIEDKHKNYYSGGSLYPPYGKPYIFKLTQEGDTISSYRVVDNPLSLGGTIQTLSFYNDTSLIVGTQFGLNTTDNWWSLNETDTIGNIIAQNHEEEHFVFSQSQVTFDNKIIVLGVTFSQYPNYPSMIGMYKFNSNLEYDSIYTIPRTYDSLCPHPIVSDTIPMPDNCVYVLLPEEPKVGELQPLKLYPNPASDFVSVELPEYAVTSDKQGVMTESRYRPIIGECELMVYDIHGRLVYNETLEAGGRNHVIITSGWGAGIYLVELEQREVRIASAKLVKR